MKRPLAVLLGVFALVLLAIPTVLADQPQTLEVHGGGTYVADSGSQLSFAITARGIGFDGTGQVELHEYASDARIHGAVDCLFYPPWLPGAVTLSGTITASDDPLLVGQSFWVSVKDSDTEGDSISPTFVGFSPSCFGSFGGLAYYPLVSGNIRAPSSPVSPPSTF